MPKSKSRCRSATWWLAPRLTFEYHNETGTCLINTRNYCHRNKIYVFPSLFKQIYLQRVLRTRIHCAINTVCHSCCRHREFTSWRTHKQRCCYCGLKMTSQLLPLTVNEGTSHRPSNNAIWDLCHVKSRLNRVSMIFLCEYHFTCTGPSLKWDSIHVQAKS